MADVADKMIEALAKLVTLTRRGAIRWSPISPTTVKIRRPDETVSYAFTANYADKKLRLYRREYEEAEPALGEKPLGHITKLSEIFHYTKAAEHRWKSEVVLEVVDEYDNALWEFPKTRILEDLMSTVKYKTSDIDDLIEKLSHELA